jgi:hypothetical protein
MALLSRSWPPGHPNDDQGFLVIKPCLIISVAVLYVACLGDKPVGLLPALMHALVK